MSNYFGSKATSGLRQPIIALMMRGAKHRSMAPGVAVFVG